MFPNDALIQEMYNSVFEFVRGSVTPIGLGQPDGKTVAQHGTGVFLAVGDVHFLVSAAHVFSDSIDVKQPVIAYAFGEKKDKGTQLVPVPLDGTIYRYDDVDIGVLRLQDASVSKFAGRRFLRLSDVQLRPNHGGWGYMLGFPRELVNDLSSTENEYNSLNISAAITYQEPECVANYDPQIHFVLDTHRDRMSRPDGLPVVLPKKFGGISGCPIWQTWWPGGDEPSYWRTRRVKVVGVQNSVYATGRYKDSPIFRASTWEAALLAIYRANPELLPTIQLHFPGLILH